MMSGKGKSGCRGRFAGGPLDTRRYASPVKTGWWRRCDVHPLPAAAQRWRGSRQRQTSRSPYWPIAKIRWRRPNADIRPLEVALKICRLTVITHGGDGATDRRAVGPQQALTVHKQTTLRRRQRRSDFSIMFRRRRSSQQLNGAWLSSQGVRRI